MSFCWQDDPPLISIRHAPANFCCDMGSIIIIIIIIIIESSNHRIIESSSSSSSSNHHHHHHHHHSGQSLLPILLFLTFIHWFLLDH